MKACCPSRSRRRRSRPTITTGPGCLPTGTTSTISFVAASILTSESGTIVELVAPSQQKRRADRATGRRARSRRARRSPDASSRPQRSRRQLPDRTERGILVQDRLLELLELTARLEAELVPEHVASLAVGLERIGLPAGSVQRQHQLCMNALPQRVDGHERLQLGHELGVPAAARSASILPSRATRRSSSRRADLRLRRSRCTAKSASGSPRQSRVPHEDARGRQTPGRSPRAPDPRSPGARSAIASIASASSLQLVAAGRVTRTGTPGCAAAGRRGSGAPCPAVGGGRPSHSSSISRSVETTSFGCSASIASSARCRPPPSSSRRPVPPDLERAEDPDLERACQSVRHELAMKRSVTGSFSAMTDALPALCDCLCAEPRDGSNSRGTEIVMKTRSIPRPRGRLGRSSPTGSTVATGASRHSCEETADRDRGDI